MIEQAATKTPAVKKSRAVTLSIQQVAHAFGVSTQAIFHWRQGTSTREPMKPVDANARSPRFTVTEVKRFAKVYGLKLVKDPAEVVSTWQPNPQAAKAPAGKAAKKTSKAVRTKPKQ